MGQSVEPKQARNPAFRLGAKGGGNGIPLYPLLHDCEGEDAMNGSETQFSVVG